jgi:FAD synthetase
MVGRTVITTGAFDILHLGHMKMLEAAKRAAGKNGRLVVVVATDKTVRKRKGRPPVFTAVQRREMLKYLKPVDDAIIGYDPFSFGRVLRRVKPDIVAFGYDQHSIRRKFEEYCRKNKVDVKVIVLPKFNVGRLDSSSRVIRHIRRTVKG